MPTFAVEGNWQAVVALLFEVDHEGHLCFSWSGRSLRPAGHDDLLKSSIRFRDYLMEGFLSYNVQVEDMGSSCILRVQGEGSNRDCYLRSHVRHFITMKGLTITAESDD